MTKLYRFWRKFSKTTQNFKEFCKLFSNLTEANFPKFFWKYEKLWKTLLIFFLKTFSKFLQKLGNSCKMCQIGQIIFSIVFNLFDLQNSNFTPRFSTADIVIKKFHSRICVNRKLKMRHSPSYIIKHRYFTFSGWNLQNGILYTYIWKSI